MSAKNHAMIYADSNVETMEEWECFTCTYINKCNSRKCEMCYEEKPVVKPVSNRVAKSIMSGKKSVLGRLDPNIPTAEIQSPQPNKKRCVENDGIVVNLTGDDDSVADLSDSQASPASNSSKGNTNATNSASDDRNSGDRDRPIRLPMQMPVFYSLAIE